MNRVLLLGGSGLVGSCVQARWADAVSVQAPTHADLDVLDDDALAKYLRRTRADSVVNFAAWADVDGAEPQRGDQQGSVYRINATFPMRLAELCADLGKHLVHVSTDYVFDGVNAERAYTETDEPHPLGWYAETKRAGEVAILAAGVQACIARIEMPYTGREHAKRDLARLVVARLRAGQAVQGVTDQHVTPVFLDDAADALRLVVEQRYIGLVHVASTSATTPFEFVASIARSLELDAGLIQPEAFARFATTRPAKRPQHPWLDVSRFERDVKANVLRPVEEALGAWAAQFTSAVGS